MLRDGPRPLLNARALLRLQTPLDIRADQLLQAANDIDGLEVKEWQTYDGLNDIVFNNDRLSMEQIDKLVENLSSFGYTLNKTDLVLSAEVEQTRVVTGNESILDVFQPDTTVVLEIPSRSTSLSNIRAAFGTTRVSMDKEINRVNVTRQESKYVIEPNTDLQFMLSGHEAIHWDALDKLGIDYKDAIYASSVIER